MNDSNERDEESERNEKKSMSEEASKNVSKKADMID
jgi:hypothetical protein